jgi:hypothetical protein
MLISERYGFVYLANPKTGSTSIEAAFEKYADFRSVAGPGTKHITYRMFRRKFRYFSNLEIVVCVRDPIATLHSWYRYRQRSGMKKPENRVEGISFEEFLMHWGKDKPPPFASINAGPTFVLTKDGKLPDLTYFRYEGTPTLHSYLAEKVGKNVPELHRNQSPEHDSPELPGRDDLDIPKLNRAYDIYDRIPFKNPA